MPDESSEIRTDAAVAVPFSPGLRGLRESADARRAARVTVAPPPVMSAGDLAAAALVEAFATGAGQFRTLSPEEMAYEESPEGIAAAEARREADFQAAQAAQTALRRREIERQFHDDKWSFVSRAKNRDAFKAFGSHDLMGMHLSAIATRLCETGWSWVLQSRGEKRYLVGGYDKNHRLHDDDASPSKRKLVRTTLEQGLRWVRTVERSSRKGTCNVALVPGPASSFWGLDDDCDNPVRSREVNRLADEVFGPTPLVRTRTGSDRSLRIYGMLPEHFPERNPEKVSWDPDVVGGHSDEVEFLVSGRCITILGLHHKSGGPFMWSGPVPGFDDDATPAIAPVVTPEQIAEFQARLRAECPGTARPPRSRASSDDDGAVPVEGVDYVDSGDMYVPRFNAQAAGMARGPVTDGRRNYVYAVVNEVVATNSHVSRIIQAHAKDLGSAACQDAVTRLKAVIMQVVERDVQLGGDTTTRSVMDGLPDQIVGCALRYQSDNVRTGRRRARVLSRSGVVDNASPQPLKVIKTLQRLESDVLKILLPRATKLPLELREGEGSEARALLDAEGIAAQRAQVSEQVRRPIQRWLDAVWDAKQGVRRVSARDMVALERDAQRVVLLMAPTGAGKTTTLLTLVREQIAQRGKIGPLLFMAPSYLLLDDVVALANPGLVEEAERAATADAEREGRAMGLRCMTYQGKSRLCTRPEGPVLAAAGVSLRNMCETTEYGMSTRTGEREKKIVKCPMKATCRAWTQIAEIAESDIVFLPTAYVSLPVPKELKSCVGLIVDESVAGRFLRADTIALESFGMARREPFVSRSEEESGMTSEVLLHDREQVAAVFADWARRNAGKKEQEDIGAVLLDHGWSPDTDPKDRPAVALSRVASAQNCIGRSANSFRQVTPTMGLEEAKAIAASPRGTDQWPEYHVYGVALDRMEALVKDRVVDQIVAEATEARGPDADPIERVGAFARLAKGKRDARLQVLSTRAGIKVRVSWRAKNSFGHLPTLLMDASASEKMVRKLWSGREVDVCRAPARLHMRVLAVIDKRFSDSSMQPWRVQATAGGDVDCAEGRRQGAAGLVRKVRAVADALSVLHGNSQVFVASTKSVEVLMHTAWSFFSNVSWLHYGACVGLNFAKLFPAGLIIGRQELPAGAVDAVVGALTYDDDEPEAPIDLYGTGYDGEGKELRTRAERRAIRMRSGQDVMVAVPVHAGAWAVEVQAQAREQQQLQAIGRIRPVYRTGEPPLIVLLTSVVPEGLVVDAVCGLDDLDVSLARRVRDGDGLVTARFNPMGSGVGAWARDMYGKPSPAWESLSNRMFQGLVRFAYDRNDGAAETVEVLACEAADVVERIRWLEQCEGRDWDRADTVREVLRAAPLATDPRGDVLVARKADPKMTALVGTRAEQTAAARAVADRTMHMPEIPMRGIDGKEMQARNGTKLTLLREVQAVMHALSVPPEGNANLAPHVLPETYVVPEVEYVVEEPVAAVEQWRYVDPEGIAA